MTHGGKRPGAGRKDGVPNKVAHANFEDVRKLVAAIFEGIDPVEKGRDLLTCGHPPTEARVWQLLMEYRYGKPRQVIEGTGFSFGLGNLPTINAEEDEPTEQDEIVN